MEYPPIKVKRLGDRLRMSKVDIVDWLDGNQAQRRTKQQKRKSGRPKKSKVEAGGSHGRA